MNGFESRSASSSAASRAASSASVAGQLAREQHELVAAGAGEQRALAGGAAQAARDAPQQPVAGGVPERVVDELEVVEVDEQQRDRASRAAARA